MTTPTNRLRPIHLAWGISLLFFLAGQAFVTRTGLEADEALFVSPLLPPFEAVYLRLFHHHWPVLLMSYLGTLKTLIYKPILHIFGASMWSLREPVLLIGAASVLLFYLALRGATGERAALVGCGLLATDSMYLLTACYDWGPVALQHLLLLGGTVLVLRFCRNRSSWALAGAFFLFGLALWDKALSIWMMSSMAVAAGLLFPRYLVSLVTRRRVAIALLAFVLGGFPLLRFNLKTHWSTFRGNFTRDQQFYRKVPYFVSTLNGEGLFGWMMPFPNDPVPSPHAADSPLTATSAEISSLAGHPTRDWMVYALGFGILLIPLARGRELRTAIFCLLVLLGAWLQMALTAGAGAAVHHTVLLWPLPQAIAAVSLAAASRWMGRAGKPAAILVAGALMASNALVLNEYYAVLWRSGPLMSWSQAILPLSDYLKTVPAGNVFVADWGILEPLRFLNFGKLPLRSAIDPLNKPAMDADDERRTIDMLDAPSQLFILHTKEAEQFPDVRDRLLRFATAHGYSREVAKQISDGYGRQIFEVCRFSKPVRKP